MTKQYKVCIVGATGAVGQAFLHCLEKRRFPVSHLTLFASSRSAGKTLSFQGGRLKVEALTPDRTKGFDFALFSAGASVSREYAPLFAKNGAVVVDNSSAFRMEPDVPLVVPEVNADQISKHKGIIANPNCSTIQLVVVLNPIHKRSKIKRVIVATYQAVSGAGARAVEELRQESHADLNQAPYERKIFPRQIAFNAIPQIPQKDAFLPNGYTVEEGKMIEETKKIMGDPSIKVTATCVRIPVVNSHSEVVNIETATKLTRNEVIEILSRSAGVHVATEDDQFPTPAEVSGQDDVFVGRVREDNTLLNGINMWIVGDNILKGAALNAIQIAEHLIR